jgi:hypothetical protein
MAKRDEMAREARIRNTTYGHYGGTAIDDRLAAAYEEGYVQAIQDLALQQEEIAPVELTEYKTPPAVIDTVTTDKEPATKAKGKKTA